MDDLRQLPYSLESEQSVLGSVLVDPDCLRDVVTVLKDETYFYSRQNALIYEALLEMFRESTPIDAVTVIEHLRENGIYEEIGGKEYLFNLAEFVPTSANAKNYAKVVADKARLRDLINTCKEIIDTCYEGEGSVRDITDLAEQRIYNLSHERINNSLTHIREILTKTFRKIELAANDKSVFDGVRTHFSELDGIISGLNNSDVIIIGGRPASGKTTFAVNIAQRVALYEKKAVAIFSLEMSKEQLVERMLSTQTMIDNDRLKSGKIMDNEWMKITENAAILSNAPIYIDDTTDITVTEIKAKLRRLNNLGLVVIDYLQLMSSPKRTENRTNEIAEISRSLKLLAKDLNIPVIMCSQLSRDNTKRPNKTPMLSDIRDSGAIEQDADVVMFIHRESLYEDTPENHFDAQCIVGKNRHGETAKIDMNFQGKYYLFSEKYKGPDGG